MCYHTLQTSSGLFDVFFVKVVSTFKGVKLEQASFGKIILELSPQFGKMAENLVKIGRSTNP